MKTHLVLAADRAATIAQTGVDPTLEGLDLQDAILSAIADRRGYLSWDVDHADWLVFLHHPEEETFHGRTLEEALAWCLVWLMAPEIGIGQYLV
jgi:phage terminase large subunit-like protein